MPQLGELTSRTRYTTNTSFQSFEFGKFGGMLKGVSVPGNAPQETGLKMPSLNADKFERTSK